MLNLFFVPDLPTTVGSTYEFAGDDAGHAIRVLRTQIGEALALSSGQGAWSIVEVIAIAKKSMTVRVVSTGFEEALPVEFTVAQALTKGDRIKESIELNTAGGADVILLWAATRSIGKAEIPNYDLTIVFHESASQKLTDVVKPGAKKVLIIIGPEGGITDEELVLFKSAGAQVALMGRPIFRSAHAGMAALSGVNAALKIW